MGRQKINDPNTYPYPCCTTQKKNTEKQKKKIFSHVDWIKTNSNDIHLEIKPPDDDHDADYDEHYATLKKKKI